MALKNQKFDHPDVKNAKRKSVTVKTIPLPVILSNSCEIAEKYDDYLRMLCKEYPTTMRNLRYEKKFIQEKKDILNSLIQKIKVDVKDMHLAVQQLNVLFDREKEFELEKEKENQKLNILLKEFHERMNVLLSVIAKFSTARTFLDTLATSNKFTNVTSLVQYYLIIEALNEQFIQLEMQCMLEMKNAEEINLKLKTVLKEHQFKLVNREKRFGELMYQLQSAAYTTSGLKQTLSKTFGSHLQEHGDWEQTKRWTAGICKKIAVYKDVSTQQKDFLRQLEEVYDFIEASRKILKR